jgi:ribosomal protein S12 methylthiotransferase accessory factor YcaO
MPTPATMHAAYERMERDAQRRVKSSEAGASRDAEHDLRHALMMKRLLVPLVSEQVTAEIRTVERLRLPSGTAVEVDYRSPRGGTA